MLHIKLVRSTIGQTPRNRATVQALGLRKINQTVEKPNDPSVLGMIQKVRHMLVVEDTETGKTLVDARTIKRNALARDKKPSERH